MLYWSWLSGRSYFYSRKVAGQCAVGNVAFGGIGRGAGIVLGRKGHELICRVYIIMKK